MYTENSEGRSYGQLINNTWNCATSSVVKEMQRKRWPLAYSISTRGNVHPSVACLPLSNSAVSLQMNSSFPLCKSNLLIHTHILCTPVGFPGGSDSKESACNTGDLALIPGSERYPGEGNGNPLQYSYLGNPMNRVAWWAIVHGVSRSWM